MNGQKQKFSELKKQAREAMAGRCGTLVGATAINLFLTFSCSLIPTLIFSGTTLYDIIFLNLTLFLFSLLLSLFQAGYLKICLSTLRGEPISVGDMLYAFYHHPDQYVLMFLIINGISSVIALISSIPGFQYLSSPSAELTLGTALSIEAELSSLMNVYVYKLMLSRFHAGAGSVFPFHLCDERRSRHRPDPGDPSELCDDEEELFPLHSASLKFLRA